MLNTAQLEDAMRVRYPANEYALIPQVGARGHGGSQRWCDFLAMGLWQSRGNELIGFELKASRSDWDRERKRPEKADAVCKYCDRWYIVAGHDKIVLEGELPATWGLLVPRGTVLYEAVKAPKLTPEPMSRSFLASILRRAAEYVVPEAKVDALIADKKQQYIDEGRWQAKADTQELERLKRIVAEFEEASGLKIPQYGGGAELGRQVAAVNKLIGGGRWDTLPRRIASAAKDIRRLADRFDEAVKSLADVTGLEDTETE